jgi:hypothetical protein
MKTTIMTSFTREMISFERVNKISTDVLSVGLPSGRNQYKLLPYNQVIEHNNRANLVVKPVSDNKFICLIDGKKLDSKRHNSEAEARLHHWQKTATADQAKLSKQPSVQAAFTERARRAPSGRKIH